VLFTFVPDEVPLTGPRNRMARLKIKPTFKTDNIYAAIEAVREGVGYAIFPIGRSRTISTPAVWSKSVPAGIRPK